MTTTTPLPISSSTDSSMDEPLSCAFNGSIHRIDVCEGVAVCFFKTAKGTIWPLCQGCSKKHKETAVNLVKTQRIEVLTAVAATFDIPLSDTETREAFRAQDPTRLQRVLELADASLLRRP